MLSGKVCIITGSSAGIGAAVARIFAKEKAEALVLHGRREVELQNVKKQCVEIGMADAKVLTIIGDITDDLVRQKLVSEPLKLFGKIDILVNNAGIFEHAAFLESDLDLYDRVFNVNVRSVVALTKLCVPTLIASKGNVVNISATLSIRSQPWACYYSMSKSALDHFTRCISLELAPKGVRVNSVNPGYVSGTDIVARTGAGSDAVIAGIEHQTKSSHPLGRGGNVDEVAEAVLWMASKGTFTTGHCLTVDGGFSIA